MARSFFFFLLCIGYWLSFVIAAKPCIPKVRGEPFVQYVENKNCEVDEKLLELFNSVSFNESVANMPTANFMCIGFIDALNVTKDSTLENLCVFGLLSDIRDDDFCSDSKMMTVLEKVVDSSVFDRISTIVANFTRQHCDVMCDGCNELCWAFGITAKLILKQRVVSTTPPTTATKPTAAPTTNVPIPNLFDPKSRTSDGHHDDVTNFSEDDKVTVEEYFHDEQLLNSTVSQDVEDGYKELGNSTENIDKQEVSPTTSANHTKGTPDYDYQYQNFDRPDDSNTDNDYRYQDVDRNTYEYYGGPNRDATSDDTRDYTTQPASNLTTTSTPDLFSSDYEYNKVSYINYDDDRYRSCWHVIALLFIFIGVAGCFAMYRRSKISESVPVVKVMEAGLS